MVNPKVLFICAAAGLAIGTDAFDIPATVLSPALFLTIAASAVATPVLPVTASLLRWSG
ncbi:hypothetical protein [Mycobacterium lacus]|uniref:Uncharacterized protein n=1 Tax=Mycobacterium lacus TaxID=169765 RepID=A0A7I7NPI6_9MYCO|nr:hypothetical protein [Mycobacterium lacus]MCV7121845.1 hypothetical protein [Mycobacterium lacus]BBX98524.1 hypothetical protein MLAC_38180 [Mycobacterium lacus]